MSDISISSSNAAVGVAYPPAQPERSKPVGVVPTHSVKRHSGEVGLTADAVASALSAISSSSVGTGQTRVGAFDAGPVRGQGAAMTRAGVESRATSHSSVGPDGASAGFDVGASAGASASAEGRVTTPLGSARGRVSVSVWLGAEASGDAGAHLGGADATVTARVGALADVNADGSATVLGGLAQASGRADAQAGTGAQATATVCAGYAPLEAAIRGSAGAFAGARSGFSASAGVAGYSVGIAAEAWAGVGAKVDIAVGLHDGTFQFSLGLGVALGVGAFLKIDFQLELKPLLRLGADALRALSEIFDAVSGLFGGGKGDGALAASILASLTQKLSEAADAFAAREACEP